MPLEREPAPSFGGDCVTARAAQTRSSTPKPPCGALQPRRRAHRRCRQAPLPPRAQGHALRLSHQALNSAVQDAGRHGTPTSACGGSSFACRHDQRQIGARRMPTVASSKLASARPRTSATGSSSASGRWPVRCSCSGSSVTCPVVRSPGAGGGSEVRWTPAPEPVIRGAGYGFFGSSPKPLHWRPPLMQYDTRYAWRAASQPFMKS
jgi:hypothetical protein